MPALPKPITAHNETLNLTFYFKKAKDAAAYLDCDPAVIAKVCKGKLDSSWGWKFNYGVPESAEFVSEDQLEKPFKYEKKKTAWNKGKTGIYTEESLKKMSISSKGKKLSKTSRNKLSESLKLFYKNNKHHALGTKLSKEAKEKISKGLQTIGLEERKKLNMRISESVIASLKVRPEEVKAQLSEKRKLISTKTTYGQVRTALEMCNMEPQFIIKFDEETLDIEKIQKVKCHCGRVWEVYLYEIVRGKIKSCGCVKSNPEREIYNFLSNDLKIKDTEIEKNARPEFMDKKELDFLLSNFKVAIEHHGLAYHSDRNWSFSKTTSRQYHLNKFKNCEKAGIKLIQFFEDEWKNKQDICKSMIASRLGVISQKIYARKTKVVKLEVTENREFFNKNHISGYTFAKHAWGLEYRGHIVCAISFRPVFNLKYKQQGFIEIARFASELNTQVVGGFSKLLKCAIDFFKEKNYKGILTYADLRFGTGEVYRSSGFLEQGETTPNYFYENRRIRRSRHLCKKNNDPDFIKKYGKTEKEQNNNQGWYAIYDAGSKVYTLTF